LETLIYGHPSYVGIFTLSLLLLTVLSIKQWVSADFTIRKPVTVTDYIFHITFYLNAKDIFLLASYLKAQETETSSIAK